MDAWCHKLHHMKAPSHALMHPPPRTTPCLTSQARACVFSSLALIKHPHLTIEKKNTSSHITQKTPPPPSPQPPRTSHTTLPHTCVLRSFALLKHPQRRHGGAVLRACNERAEEQLLTQPRIPRVLLQHTNTAAAVAAARPEAPTLAAPSMGGCCQLREAWLGPVGCRSSSGPIATARAYRPRLLCLPAALRGLLGHARTQEAVGGPQHGVLAPL